LLDIKNKGKRYIELSWWDGLITTVVTRLNSLENDNPVTHLPIQMEAICSQGTKRSGKSINIYELEESHEDLSQASATLTSHEKVEKEVFRYRDNTPYDKFNTVHSENQLAFWSLHSAEFPLLSDFALFVLAAQATEAESERLFSIAGRILIPSRAGKLIEFDIAAYLNYSNCP